jgi:hypothetical protein
MNTYVVKFDKENEYYVIQNTDMNYVMPICFIDRGHANDFCMQLNNQKGEEECLTK